MSDPLPIIIYYITKIKVLQDIGIMQVDRMVSIGWNTQLILIIMKPQHNYSHFEFMTQYDCLKVFISRLSQPIKYQLDAYIYIKLLPTKGINRPIM